MSSPHQPGRADRLLLRAIFLMLALLLHIEAIRHFSPRFVKMPAAAKAPLVVQLTPPAAPANGSQPPKVGEAEAAAPPLPLPMPLPAMAPPLPAAATTLPSPPQPYYHSPRALTRPPELVEDGPAEIELPESQEPGKLLLRLAIDRYGVVNAVNVLQSTLPRELEGQVVLQFYRARYRPGEIDGVPVNGELLLVVNLQ